MTSRVQATGRERTVEHPAETPGGNSPPDFAIYTGSSPSLFPVRATGLDYTMEHPAETPGGNSPLDCCILMGSNPAAYTKIKRSPQAPFLLNVEMEKRPQPHQRKEFG